MSTDILLFRWEENGKKKGKKTKTSKKDHQIGIDQIILKKIKALETTTTLFAYYSTSRRRLHKRLYHFH